jgi:hypothetical protein
MGISTIKHPTVNINVIDKSRAVLTRNIILPFHTPFFPLSAAKGPTGIKWIESFQHAMQTYGEETFTSTSKWYSREAIYIETALRNGNQCYIMRVMDDKAKVASAVIEAYVQNIEIPQYQRDEDNNYILDEYDNPLPILDGQNNPITKMGIKLKYTVRALTDADIPNKLTKRVLSINGTDTTLYPIMVFQAKTSGSYGNSLGFRINRNFATTDTALMQRNNILLYQFSAMEQPYNSDVAQTIKTVWNENWADFTFKPSTIDQKTMQNLSLEYVLEKLYYDNIGLVSDLPYDVIYYPTYIEEISTKIQVSEDSPEITSPWMVDIFQAKDMQGRRYNTAILDDDSIRFNDNYIIYLQAGNDGDTSREKFEEIFKSYLTLIPDRDLANPWRFPFNALYDTGYSIVTKNAMISFLGHRDDVVVRLSTQDMSLPPNTKNADYSSGSYLASSLLLQPESIISGTGCCRGEIYAHVGQLNDTSRYSNYLSTTLEVLLQITNHQSTPRLLGAPQASPAANLTLLNPEKFIWHLDDANQNELFWNAGINYVQWCSQVDMFFPSRRTVHQWDTSLLSDSTFVDVLVQCKRIIRDQWRRFTGISTVPLVSLFDSIKRGIENAFYERIPNGFTLVANVFQTDSEREDGTITHVTLNLYGQLPQRTWNVDIIVDRIENA